MLDLATIKARAVVRLAAATAPGARAAAAAKPANPTIRALVAEAPGPIGQLATLAKLASNNATSRLAEQGRRPDPDRWCWPHSDAMNTVELATMTARLRKFERRGFAYAQAEQVADRLVRLDRQSSGLRVCAECSRLSGTVGRAWRCNDHRAAGVAPDLPADLVTTPQRCPAFKESTL